MSDSLRPCGLQHARFLCPLLSPGVGSNSRPFSWWCYLTISSSAALFSFCLQFFWASGSFPVSWLFALASAISPSNEYSGLIDFISLQSKGPSKVSKITVQKNQFFSTQPSLWSQSYIHTTTGKTIALTRWTFVSKVMSLLYNTLSGFVIYRCPYPIRQVSNPVCKVIRFL